MAFKFPTVYDALFAEKLAERKAEPLFRNIEDKNNVIFNLETDLIDAGKRLKREKREAYFLGTGVSRPYMAEIIPFEEGYFNPETTKGLFISAKTRNELATEIGKRMIKVGDKDKPILFKSGEYYNKDLDTLNPKTTTKPTKVNDKNLGNFLNKVPFPGEKSFIAHGDIAKVNLFQKPETKDDRISTMLRRDILGN